MFALGDDFAGLIRKGSHRHFFRIAVDGGAGNPDGGVDIAVGHWQIFF